MHHPHLSSFLRSMTRRSGDDQVRLRRAGLAAALAALAAADAWLAQEAAHWLCALAARLDALLLPALAAAGRAALAGAALGLAGMMAQDLAEHLRRQVFFEGRHKI